MTTAHISNTYVIKRFPEYTTIEDYVDGTNTKLQGIDSEIFNLELDSVKGSCYNPKEVDNKVDIICANYL